MEEAKDQTVNEAEETLELFEEYKRKFTEAIEKEKQRVREQAEKESSNIIAEAEQQARQIGEKTIKQAEEEAVGIIAKSRVLAGQIVSEVGRFAEIVTDVKQKIKQESEKAQEKIGQEVNVVTTAIRSAEKTIGDARNKVEEELEKSATVIAEAKRKLEQVTNVVAHDTEQESQHRGEPVGTVVAITQQKEEVTEPTIVESSDSVSTKASDDKLFVGTLELSITPPGHPALLQRLQKCLSQIPGLEILLVNGPAGERTRVTIFIAKPIPLLHILKEMTLVKSAVKDKDGIQIVMQTSDGWKD